MTASDVLRGALDLLPDESRWVRKRYEDGRGGICVNGALSKAATGVAYGYGIEHPNAEAIHQARDLVMDEVALPISTWNDDPHTTFEDVRLTLKRALGRAEESDGIV